MSKQSLNNYVEYLIETYFHEVLVPLHQILPTPPETKHKFDGENPKINLEQIMGELQE
jgi:hypothetical protein